MITKTFGRDPGNTVVIPKADISGFHAKVSFDGQFFYIEDTDSLNMTYVNGHPIRKATVTANDEVRLSKDTVLNLPKIFGVSETEKKQGSNQKDFTSQFTLLKTIWENYQRKSITEKRKEALLRAIVTLSPLIFWVIFQYTFVDRLPDNEKIGWQNKYIFFSVILSTIGNLLIGGNSKSAQRKMEEDESFQLTYVCPNSKCRSSLGKYSWKYWEQKGKCTQCQAVYSKNYL